MIIIRKINNNKPTITGCNLYICKSTNDNCNNICNQIQSLYFHKNTSTPTIKLLNEFRSNNKCYDILSYVKDTLKKFYRTYHIFGGNEYRCRDLSKYLEYFLEGRTPRKETEMILINLIGKIISLVEFTYISGKYKPINIILSRCYHTIFT